MKKLVLCAAFFSVICFGSCNKNKGSQENAVEESSTETEKVLPPAESEDSQEVSPGEESKVSEEQSLKGEK